MLHVQPAEGAPHHRRTQTGLIEMSHLASELNKILDLLFYLCYKFQILSEIKEATGRCINSWKLQTAQTINQLVQLRNEMKGQEM